MPKLSDTKIRAAKAKEIPYKLYDSDGLFLIVHPKGGRWWRVKYFWAGKEQTLSAGTYPEISLAKARERRDSIRSQVANKVNPSSERREEKLAQLTSGARTYRAIALDEWLPKTAAARSWTAEHVERIRRRFEVHFVPWVGHKDISEVTEDDITGCLTRMTDRNLIDTARRARSENNLVFRFAKQRRLVKHNPVTDLLGPDVLPNVKVKHHAAITDPAQVGPLLRAIDNYHGGFAVRCALRLMPFVFARPGELQWANWSEFDLDGPEPTWRIPAERMKMRKYHLVPLSRQAVAILHELHPVTGPEGYVFPQVRNASRPMSENTLNVALRACGYTKEQQTGHGFRTTASTLLNEGHAGRWHPDAIERQLAHVELNKVRASYNAAEHLPERRKMMQVWADYLDGLRNDTAKVVSIKRAGSGRPASSDRQRKRRERQHSNRAS
jgi:integrase